MNDKMLVLIETICGMPKIVGVVPLSKRDLAFEWLRRNEHNRDIREVEVLS